MEGNTKKPYIIEFNGLPGSGKTTIANALQKELESAGLTVKRFYLRTRLFRSPRILYFMPQYWVQLKNAADYAKLLPKRTYMRRILSMIHYFKMYQEFVRDEVADYLIIDQGIVQSFISLAHQDTFPKSNELAGVLRKLRLNEFPLILINCNINEQLSNERIASRPSNGCRVESMSEEDRRRTLYVQLENFALIRKLIKQEYPQISVLEVDTEKTIKESVYMILRRIGKKSIMY